MESSTMMVLQNLPFLQPPPRRQPPRPCPMHPPSANPPPYVPNFNRTCTHWVSKPNDPSMPNLVWPSGASYQLTSMYA